MKTILPSNFTENDVVFEKDTDKKFISMVYNSIINPLGGKVFIRDEQNNFLIYNEEKTKQH